MVRTLISCVKNENSNFSPGFLFYLKMIMITIIFILLSNAVILRRDLSILFNRIAIIGLIYCILQNLITFSILTKSVGLQGGLIYINNITQIFHLFIFLLSILILQLTSFYPRKLSNINIITKTLINLQSKVLDKRGEQFKIIEYPLIMLFIITGACLLISTNDLHSLNRFEKNGKKNK